MQKSQILNPLFQSAGPVLRCILLCAAAVSLVACPSKRAEPTRDPVHEATLAIDRGELETGISSLEAIIASDASNDRARVALASGYMKKAGLTVDRFYRLGETFFVADSESKKPSTLRRLSERIRGRNRDVKSTLNSTADFLIRLDQFLNETDLLLSRIDEIPEISDEHVQLVRGALNQLQEIRSPTSGNLLYRALTRSVYLKYQLSDGRWLKFASNGLCSAVSTDIQNFLTALHIELTSVFSDAALALPKSREGLLKIRGDINSYYMALSSVLARDPDGHVSLATLLKTQNAKPSDVLTCDF